MMKYLAPFFLLAINNRALANAGDLFCAANASSKASKAACCSTKLFSGNWRAQLAPSWELPWVAAAALSLTLDLAASGFGLAASAAVLSASAFVSATTFSGAGAGTGAAGKGGTGGAASVGAACLVSMISSLSPKDSVGLMGGAGTEVAMPTLAAGAAGVVWDEVNFVEYAQDPTSFLKAKLGGPAKSKMAFKVKDAASAADVYAYLAQFSPAK